ncbi:MAG: thiol:disulfide interchange protein DsbA/DsbL [Gammaproteobacteria bacterium]|nr:MAG: thiol:disulfide interchange protein DsbA/DsbL [Gammaproteobacteria bacterium]
MLRRIVILFVGLFAVAACHADPNAASAASGAGSAAAPAAAPAPASAAAPAREWQLGADSGDKVEVAEVFSYACPHCAHFQPTIDELKTKLPANAQLVLVPAVFRPEWEPFARAFYAAKSMGVLDKTHQALFDAMHKDHLPLNTLDTLATAFYANHGVNPQSFVATANSFVVDSQLARGNQLVKDYGINGTPTLVVNGKYRVELSPEHNIGAKEVVEIVLQLVKQESAQVKAGAAKSSQ